MEYNTPKRETWSAMNPSRLLRPFFAVRTAAVLAAAALAAPSARAATETANGYTWTYEIVGDGAVIGRDDYKAAIDPKPGQNASVTIPATLGGKPVTGIGAYAFSHCEGMRDVGIPSTVTSIGNSAFFQCIALDLNSLSLPETSSASASSFRPATPASTASRSARNRIPPPVGRRSESKTARK